jgi:hypothetical protein
MRFPMKGKILVEARKLFRARKFSEAIRLLEPEVYRHRENFEYFSLLGFSCLHAGDVGGAFSYISRAHQLKADDVSALLGLAAIHFRRSENEAAIKRWLEILEMQPSNRIARRGLDLLRRGLGQDGLQDFIDTGRLKLLYPPLPSRGRGVKFLVIVLAVLIVAGLGYLGYKARGSLGSERPGVAAIEIPTDLSRLIETGTDFTFVFTEREIRQVFQKAKGYLLDYRDNLANIEINRILLSNAALPIQERARLLKGFITQPTFDTLRDSFPYAKVALQPALYDGCTVRWKGKIANLKTGKDAMSFDYLVGYDQERELEGIVPVSLPFAAQLENGIALEVLGQVQYRTGKLALRGVSVHRLAVQ